MHEINLGPVANPDGSPTEITKQMLSDTGRDPEVFAMSATYRDFERCIIDINLIHNHPNKKPLICGWLQSEHNDNTGHEFTSRRMWIRNRVTQLVAAIRSDIEGFDVTDTDMAAVSLTGIKLCAEDARNLLREYSAITWELTDKIRDAMNS